MTPKTRGSQATPVPSFVQRCHYTKKEGGSQDILEKSETVVAIHCKYVCIFNLPEQLTLRAFYVIFYKQEPVIYSCVREEEEKNDDLR